MRRAIILVVVGLVLGGALVAGLLLFPWDKTGKAGSVAAQETGRPPVALVLTAPVVSKEIPIEFTVMGTVMPARRSVVAAGSPGRVIDFLVNEGDYVTKDQPLVQQRLKDLEIEREAALATLEYRWQDFCEMLVGYHPREIEQARARLAWAEVQETNTRIRYQRVTRAGSASSREDVDEAKNALDAATQTVVQARANYNQALEGPRVEMKARARALVDAAHEDVQRIEEEIWKKTLRAPFDGYIAAEHTEVGQWLNQGATAIEVIELKELEVEVKVPERHVGAVEEGQAATVQIEALGAVGDQALQGKVIRVVPQVDPQSRTMPVRIRIANRIDANHRPWIKAGQLAQVSFRVSTRRSMLVPKDALVLASGRDPVVFVVDTKTETVEGQPVTKSVARPVPVKTGNPYESSIEVQGDLQPGMQVIVRGNERIRPGQEVRAEAYGR